MQKFIKFYLHRCDHCSCENYKAGCDWARVSFSRDINRIAAGSSDGAVYIWNVNGQLEATLKDSA